MKNKFLLFSIFTLTKVASQTLPPVAQALYDEFYNADVTRGQYSLTNGAQAIATADGNSFYLKWVPANSVTATIPLLVTLHGSDGNAFNEFYLWHQYAADKGVAIIALQWYRGAASIAPNDYFNDNTLYTYIDTALKRVNYPSGKAFYHGFSRGSARSYAIAFIDVQPDGKNYFCTILSNAGKPDSLYPLYTEINSGTYGHSFFMDKKWAMYCGGLDPDPNASGCPGMTNAKIWVEANGGTVGLFIQDANLGHGGFHQTPAYINSALDYYLTCYNTVGNSLLETSESSAIFVFPNPTSDHFTIQSIHSTEKSKVKIYTELLENICVIDFVGSATINTSKWKKGIYFYEILSSESKRSFGKMVVQ